jgi:hypothetical protein
MFRELKDREKMNRISLSLQHLLRYADEGEDMFNRIVTGDESWMQHYQPESKPAEMRRKYPSSPDVTPSAGKVLLTVFWDSQGVLLAHFQKSDESVNSATYCEVLLKLRDAIPRKHPGQQAREVLLNMAMPEPIQPEQPRREFKNYSGNFLNIRLTARTWLPVTSTCLVR